MRDVVFIVGVELSRESKNFQEQGYAGGFVNCVTFAPDIPTALNKCEKALKQDGYGIVMFDSVFLYNPTEFEGSNATLDAVGRLKSENHEVQYGNFHVYGH